MFVWENNVPQANGAVHSIEKSIAWVDLKDWPKKLGKLGDGWLMRGQLWDKL